MAISCPCCGQAIKDANFKVSLEFNTVIVGDRALEVTPTQAEIIFILRQHYPANVHKTRIMLKLWGAEQRSDQGLRSLLYQTRKQLEKIGYTILNSTTQGYRLSKQRKEVAQ